MTVVDVHKAIKRHGPISTVDIADRLKVTVSTVTRQIKTLRGCNCVYISTYLKQPGGHGRRTPLYCAGDQEDAVHPVYVRRPEPSQCKPLRQPKKVQPAPRPVASGIWGGLMR